MHSKPHVPSRGWLVQVPPKPHVHSRGWSIQVASKPAASSTEGPHECQAKPQRALKGMVLEAAGVQVRQVSGKAGSEAGPLAGGPRRPHRFRQSAQARQQHVLHHLLVLQVLRPQIGLRPSPQPPCPLLYSLRTPAVVPRQTHVCSTWCHVTLLHSVRDATASSWIQLLTPR